MIYLNQKPVAFEKWLPVYLKTGCVLVNKIAGGINDDISLSQTTKRFRKHYNKKGFFLRLFRSHMGSIKGKINHGDYILYDGSDIQKRYARFMEGLDFVKDGDKGTIGRGYWLMNAVHFSKDQELIPLYNKLYSYDHGAKSENMEVMEAIKEVNAQVDKDVTSLFDRGMDRPILREFIMENIDKFVLRLNSKTKLIHKGNELSVNKISRKVPLFMKLNATRIHKTKKQVLTYECGAMKIKYKTKSKEFELWLVVTKRTNGGYCWLLTRSPKQKITEVIEEAFKAYGFRWKIEEYHRHIKKCYSLEDVQIKTFEGLQSILAILTVATSIIYASLSSLHTRLILESGIKTMNKEKLYELYNFIYYKISTIVKVLLANFTPRAFLPQCETLQNSDQLKLHLNFD